MPLERLIYVSRAPSSGEAELQRIIGTSQVNNRRRDLTGALAYTGRHFVQVLEGDPQALSALLQSLQSDDRHDGLRVLMRRAVAQRKYDGWAMELVLSLDQADAVQALIDQPPAEPDTLEAFVDGLLAELRDRHW
jgi:hypothetical protein